MSELKNKVVRVVAGVLTKTDGNIMLGSRPEGKPYAGYWEFPGGKIEPGETAFEALVREFQEELGITVTHATPWLSKVHHYEHATVHLQFFRVWAWEGAVSPQEGQHVAWQMPGQYAVGPMLPANGPILKSLSLPGQYVITCAHELGVSRQLECLEQRTEHSIVQIREPQMSLAELKRFTYDVADVVRRRGGVVLVNADPESVSDWPVDGVHLSSARLQALSQRPNFEWVGASIHDGMELAKAEQMGLDYGLLSPVLPTASHPGQAALGWEGFRAVLTQGNALPVYALGGLKPSDEALSRQYGAHGIAIMRSAWS